MALTIVAAETKSYPLSATPTPTPTTVTPSDEFAIDVNPQNPPKSSRLRVFADVPFLIRFDGQTVNADSLPVSAEYKGVEVVVPYGVAVSFMARGSASGTLWLTHIRKTD